MAWRCAAEAEMLVWHDRACNRIIQQERCQSTLGHRLAFSTSSNVEKGTVAEAGSAIQSGSLPRRPARFLDLAPTTCRSHAGGLGGGVTGLRQG